MPYYRVYGKFKSGGKGDIRVMAMSEQGAMEKAIKEREFNPTSAEKYTNMPFPEQLEKVKKLNIEMPEGVTYEELKTIIKIKEDYPFSIEATESFLNYAKNKYPEEEEIRINKYTDYMQLIELLYEYSEYNVKEKIKLLILLILNNMEGTPLIYEVKEEWTEQMLNSLAQPLLEDKKLVKEIKNYWSSSFAYAGELNISQINYTFDGNNMTNYVYKTVAEWLVINKKK